MADHGDNKAGPFENSVSALEALVRRAADHGRGPAPVDKWNPPDCGAIDMEIRADGTWYYMGTPIGREPLVQLFSSVLRRDDDGQTYLVTPGEKLAIRVQDAPLLGVELHAGGTEAEPELTLRTKTGEVVVIGPDHPLRFAIEPATGGVKPYVLVRGRLEALLTRAVTHQLLALARPVTIDGSQHLSVRSGGAEFAVAPFDETLDPDSPS